MRVALGLLLAALAASPAAAHLYADPDKARDGWLHENWQLIRDTSPPDEQAQPAASL